MTSEHFPRLISSDKQSSVQLSGRVVTIGSAKECQLQLTKNAPKRLAHIIYRNGAYYIQGLTKTKAIHINGSPIGISSALHHGDKVHLLEKEYLFQEKSDATNSKETSLLTSNANIKTPPIHQLIDVCVSLLKDRKSNRFEDLVAAVSRLLKCDAARLLKIKTVGSETTKSQILDELATETIAKFPEGTPLQRFSNQAIIWAQRSKKTVLTNDIRWSEGFGSMDSIKRNSVGSILCAPLKEGDAIIGYLYMDRLQASQPFTEDDQAFCEILLPLFEEILSNWEEQNRQRETIVRLQKVSRSAEAKILYESESMRNTMETASRIAVTDTPILISGDTGTGKELLARYIHEKSIRADKPFIPVNCGAIPENLIESELFGYEKGAFTGAFQQKKGLFEAAHRGTLLLDEIGELPLSMQVKLLRVLQEGEVIRVGATSPVKVNVRILSATNRDLSVEIQEKRFREDLFFRLNVINIDLPPLNRRSTDVLLIAEYFVTQYCQQYGLGVKVISPSARKSMLRYPWPGNIRELENSIQKAVLLSNSSRITQDDLKLDEKIGNLNNSSGEGRLTLKEARNQAEKIAITDALEHCRGNVSQAARNLDIDRTWLMKIMKELEIDPTRFRN